jgi:heme-degrading monooxygenase HmoA
MFVRIWQFRVRSGKEDEFRAVYSSTGPWAQLFGRMTGFSGTELLQSANDPHTYFTLDLWESAETWAAFLRAWADDYAALNRRCESLTEAETEIGEFQGIVG